MSQAAAEALLVEANALFRAERFAEAAQKFEKAGAAFPQHALAWKGLGQALLCMGRAHEATTAFDRAIGLAPQSATALWGGAVAHAEIGNKVVAQSYLRRVLALQPSWIEMARSVPQLQPFLQISTRAADGLRAAFGAFSTRTYRHANEDGRSIEVGRVPNQPAFGKITFVTIGLSNREWPESQRPRVELVMASTVDVETCGQILANLAFHLADTGFFPEPSVVVRDVIGALGAGSLSERLPHVFIGVPRLWELTLPLETEPLPITLAQVIPISEHEYGLWRQNVLGFEATFEARGIDVADLKRPG